MEIKGKKVSITAFNIKNNLFCLFAVFCSIKNTKAVFYSLGRAIADWGVPHWKYKDGPVNVTLKIDEEIPTKDCTRVYMSYLLLPLGIIGFINREFGRSVAQKNTEKFFNDMADFYTTSGCVYREIQTTMIKPNEGSIAIKIIRKLVPPNCMLPSLHVQIVCHVLFNAYEVIDKYSKGEDYKNYKSRLYQQAVDIIESCLISKQHAVADIAAGFFAYSARNKGFRKSELAEKITEDLFRGLERAGEMPSQSANKARNVIKQIYKEMLASYKTENKEYTKVLLEYIGKL